MNKPPQILVNINFFNDLGDLSQGMLSTEVINPKTEGRFFHSPPIVEIPVVSGTQAARSFTLKLKVTKKHTFSPKTTPEPTTLH